MIDLSDIEYDMFGGDEDFADYSDTLFGEPGFLDPSKCTWEYWLHAVSKKRYKKFTKNSGKWLVFSPQDQIDAAWNQIKDATERGLLGGWSKVSTLRGFNGKDHVVCIYTYNWKDEKDVMRVRNVLRKLGFVNPMPYKTDQDTRAGKYASKNHNISKYFE